MVNKGGLLNIFGAMFIGGAMSISHISGGWFILIKSVAMIIGVSFVIISYKID